MQKTAATAEVRDEIIDVVAYNLRERMKQERWSGRAFALSLGLQPIYVQRRMSGETEMTVTDIKVFGDKLGMRVQDFYKVPPTGIEPATYGTDVRRFTSVRDARERDEPGTLHDLAAYRERSAELSA